MSFRVININNNAFNIRPIATNFPTNSSIKQMIKDLKDEKGAVIVNSGSYDEDIIVPDGVSLIGNGVVKLNGNIILNGEGIFKSIDVSSTISVRGNRVIEKCASSLLEINDEAYVNCFNSHISSIDCKGGNILARCSIIGSDKSKYCIKLYKGMMSIENCTIEGVSHLLEESVLDCKNSSIIGNDVLFQTEDETSVLQLFNCTVFGERLIKNGPGKSTRFNITALSTAKDFEGGENIKIESI